MGVVGGLEVLKGFWWLSVAVEEVGKGCTEVRGFRGFRGSLYNCYNNIIFYHSMFKNFPNESTSMLNICYTI